MKQPSNRLRSLLFWGASAMVSIPAVAAASDLPSTPSQAQQAEPLADQADVKEVVLNVFGMT